MHNTILQRVKELLNVKMINLEKIKQKKCQPPPPFQEDLPLHYTSIPFLIFQILPPGEVMKISFPPLERGGDVRTMGKLGINLNGTTV